MWLKIKNLLLSNRDTRQTIAKNTFWLGVSNIGGRLLRSIIIIYAARILGAAGWGVFSYATTVAGVLTLFVDLGINSVLMRESARAEDPERRLRMISSAFYFKFVLIVFGALGVAIIPPLLTGNPDAQKIFPIIALIFIFDSLREFGFSIIRSLEQMEREAFLYLLTNLGIVVFGFAFLVLRPGVISFAQGYAVGTAIGFVATAYSFRKSLGQFFRNFYRPYLISILKASWPFAISGLLGMLMINTDILILGLIRSVEEVGYFSAGQRIIQLTYLLPGIIATSALPAFARLAHQNSPRMKDALERLLSVNFLIGIPVSVGGILTAKPLVAFLFGSAYLPAVTSFQILLLTLVIDFSAVILSNAIFAYDRQKNLIVYAAIGGFLNVALDLLFIPRWGIAGCAWATFLAQLVSNYYLWRTLKRLIPFRLSPHLIRIFPATAAMGILLLILISAHVQVILMIALGGLLYLSLLYFMKEPLFTEAASLLKSSAEPPQEPAL